MLPSPQFFTEERVKGWDEDSRVRASGEGKSNGKGKGKGEKKC
jgi:hypothetical protein